MSGYEVFGILGISYYSFLCFFDLLWPPSFSHRSCSKGTGRNSRSFLFLDVERGVLGG